MELKKDKTKLYHYFHGDNDHLVLNFIKTFCKYTTTCNYFLVYITKPELRLKYEELFRELCVNDFYIWGDSRNTIIDYARCLIYNLKNYIHFDKTKYHLKDVAREKVFILLEGCKLVLHGEPGFIGMGGLHFLLKTPNPNFLWVCWGYIPKIEDEEKMSYANLIYKALGRANTIVALTNADLRNLKQTYPKSNIVFRPYIDDNNYFVCKSRMTNKILIGNSSNSIYSYDWILEILNGFDGLDITFMLNYGVKTKKDVQAFKTRCRNYKPFNITFWENKVPIDDYIKVLSNYNVYICAVERQTGLGAIYACLALGHKIYLTGVNYEHCVSLGFTVYHIDELKNMSANDDIFMYSDTIRENNRKRIKEFLDPQIAGTEWSKIIDESFK